MRHRFLTATAAAAALMIGACGRGGQPISSSPVSPSPVSPASSNPLPGAAAAVARIPGYEQAWLLTTVARQVTGESCGVTPAPAGTQHSGLMAAARSGSAVKFLYWVSNYPTDDVDYAGSLQGDEFTARTDPWPASSFGTFQGSLVGRFSADGRHVDASEIWTWHCSSGDEQYLIDWTADRLDP